MKHRLLSATLCIVLCALPALAMAQGDTERMRELSTQATEAYSKGEFAKAGELFMKAYEAQPEPVLIKNAMVAWYSDNENCGKAEPLAVRFLSLPGSKPGEDDPQDVKERKLKDRSDAETVVVRCRLQRARAELNGKDPVAARAALEDISKYNPKGEDLEAILTIKDEIAQLEKELEDNNEEPDPTPDPNPNPEGPSSDGPSGMTIAGWTMTGVGGVALLGGGLYFLNLRSLNNDLSTFDDDPDARGVQVDPEECDASAECRETYDTLDRRVQFQTPMAVATVAGGVLVATGVTLIVLGKKGPEESAPTTLLLPSLSRDGAGVSLHVRF